MKPNKNYGWRLRHWCVLVRGRVCPDECVSRMLFITVQMLTPCGWTAIAVFGADVVYYGPNVDAVRENFRHCRLWYAASSSQCFPWHFLWSVFSLVSSIDSAIHACRTRRTLDQKPTVPIREAETGIQQPFRRWDSIDGGHAHKSTVYNGPE